MFARVHSSYCIVAVDRFAASVNDRVRPGILLFAKYSAPRPGSSTPLLINFYRSLTYIYIARRCDRNSALYIYRWEKRAMGPHVWMRIIIKSHGVACPIDWQNESNR